MTTLEKLRSTYRTPLMRVAKHMGLAEPNGMIAVAAEDVKRFVACVDALNDLPRRGRCLSQEGAELVAAAVLTRRPLSTCTYICVSDYVGGVRYRAQCGVYALTRGEREMLDRAAWLRQQLALHGVELRWTLVLADVWGLSLYPDRLEPGAIDAYCAFMTGECDDCRFVARRWTELMRSQQEVFDSACAHVCETAEQLAPEEARCGEIGKDHPAAERAVEIAQQHITYRAAEGAVVVRLWGPTLVLSTESKALRKYDNLVVARWQYSAIDAMPKYPHRLSSAELPNPTRAPKAAWWGEHP